MFQIINMTRQVYIHVLQNKTKNTITFIDFFAHTPIRK